MKHISSNNRDCCYFTVNGKMIDIERMKSEIGLSSRQAHNALEADVRPLHVTAGNALRTYLDDETPMESMQAYAALQALSLRYVTEDEQVATVPRLDLGRRSDIDILRIHNQRRAQVEAGGPSNTQLLIDTMERSGTRTRRYAFRIKGEKK